MSLLFVIATLLFIVVSVAMVLIILVQRPQGGGLASAFGGAGGGGTETAFGGRTGDVLTVTTTCAFIVYLVLAMVLNISDNRAERQPVATPASVTGTTDGAVPEDESTLDLPVMPTATPEGESGGAATTPATDAAPPDAGDQP